MKYLLYLALLALFFIPGGLFRPDQFIFMIMLIWGIMAGKLSRISLVKRDIIVLFLMIVSASFSIMLAQAGSAAFTWRDLMVIPQLALYGVILAGVSMVELDEGEAKHFIAFLLGISVAASIVSICQYFNLFGLNRILGQIYLTKMDYILLQKMVSYRRITGTLENPNYWGLLISQFLIIVAYLLIWRKKIILIPLFLALLASLIFTGSRTSVVSLILGTTASTFILTFFSAKRPSVPILVILVAAVLSLSSYLILSKTYEQKDRFAVSNVKTLNDRVNHWNKVMNSIKDDLYFGIGPAKAVKATWVDNSYIKLISDFGLLGLALYMIFLWQMLWFCLSRLKNLNIINADYLIIFMTIFFGWIIFELTTDAWSQARCAPIFLTLYAITKSVVSKKKIKP